MIFTVLSAIILLTVFVSLKKGENIMDQILALVQQILEYFKEFDAAAVIEMVKNFIAGLLG